MIQRKEQWSEFFKHFNIHVQGKVSLSVGPNKYQYQCLILSYEVPILKYWTAFGHDLFS